MSEVARYRCEQAWLGGPQATPDVTLSVVDGTITAITTADVATTDAAGDTVTVAGLTLPGAANVHSHAFHRALRGTAQGAGSFWTWRDEMYALAARLTPERYQRLATAVFAEMLIAGYTCVGEFHYLHHQPDGSRYDDPNAMGAAIVTAARHAGIRLTLLDTCYLHGGIGDDGALLAVDAVQQRFADGSATAWAERATTALDALAAPTVRVGAAIHSVRAVEPDEMRTVAAWTEARRAPLHAHVSEQPAENAQCHARHGASPVGVLAQAGVLGPQFTAVHATHLSGDDVAALGVAGCSVCFCPTTERDLADGIGPSTALTAAGATLCIGSDSHAVVDSFEETRAVELDERLASTRRGSHDVAALHSMRAAHGYAALGWTPGGTLAVGAPADFVTVALDTPRTAGRAAHALARVLFAATAADVRRVVVAGRTVVADGAHVSVDVGAALTAAIAECR